MNYSNTRYTKFNRGSNIILPPQKINPIQPIQPIPTIEDVQHIQGYTSLSARQQKYKELQKDKDTQTFLSNYNDPTELNSYIDALINKEAVSKKFGETRGTISTASGTASLIADIAAIVLEAVAWIVSFFVPDAGAIGAAGKIAGTAIRAGSAASKTAKAVSTIGKVAKGLKTASKVLAIPAIPAAIDVTVEKSIKPILAGKPDEAALNMLMNLGETMDRYANPIKGLILEGPEGFVKATGLSSTGRTNYDYDTGFFLTDMLLEVITDPLNIVESAARIGHRAAINTTIEPTVNTIVDNTVNVMQTGAIEIFSQASKETGERISKTVSKATKKTAMNWAEATADGFQTRAKELAAKRGKIYSTLSKSEKDELIALAQKAIREEGQESIQNSLVRAIKKEFPEATADEIDLLLKKSGKEYAEKAILRSVTEQIEDITLDTLSSQVIKSTSELIKLTDDSERLWTKRAMLTSGYGLGIEAIKEGYTGLKVWARNISIRNLAKINAFKPGSGLDIRQYAKAKKVYQASYKYVHELTGKKATRDMASFYAFVNDQFSRDRQFITTIMQSSEDVLKKAGSLEGQFITLYECTFKDYIGFIKGINNAENGAFNDYVKYLEQTYKTLEEHATRKGLGETVKSSTALFNVNEIATDNILIQLINAFKTKKVLQIYKKRYTQ